MSMEKCDSKYCGCLYFSANALARVATKMADEEFAIAGLSPSHAFLVMSVNDKPGIQPKELSELMMLTPSTITRLIEKMEHRGILTRKVTGKFTEVHPTEKSIELDAKIKEAWMNLFKRYTNILGLKEGQNLTNMIYEATKKLES